MLWLIHNVTQVLTKITEYSGIDIVQSPMMMQRKTGLEVVH